MKKYATISLFTFCFLLSTLIKAQSWYPLNSDLFLDDGTGQNGGGVVQAIHVYNNKLIVGGAFTKAGSIVTTGVASWNGVNWNALGSGITFSFGSGIGDFATYNNELYMGGNFNEVGYVLNTNKIARWNGTSWSSVGGGGAAGSNINALEVYNGYLYAVGGFIEMGGVNVNCCIAKWTTWLGTYWSPIIGGDISDVASSMITYNGNLYVGGIFIAPGDTPAYNIARYDGSQWHPVGIGVDGRVDAFAVDPINNKLYVGGSFLNSYNLDSTVISTKFVSQWDGQQWSSLPGMPLQTNCTSLRMYHGKLYAAGWAATGDTSDINFAIWDGKSWETITGLNNGINAMAVYQDNLYVGGYFTYTGNDSAYYIAKWYAPNVPTCLNYTAAIATDADIVFLSDTAAVQFYDNSNIAVDSWQWDFGDGNNDTVENPVHAYDSVGAYLATLIVTCGAYSDTAYMTITVLGSCSEINTAIFTLSDTVILIGDTAQVPFYDSSNVTANGWYWDFGDSKTDTVKNPVHTYNSAGTYTVTLIASYGNCSDTAYAAITVEGSVGVDEFNTRSPKLKIYPNPTKDSFTIETYLPNTENGMIRIYGIKGALIKKYVLKKGSNSTILNTSGWAKGVYVCSLEVGDEVVQSKKMVIK